MTDNLDIKYLKPTKEDSNRLPSDKSSFSGLDYKNAKIKQIQREVSE